MTNVKTAAAFEGFIGFCSGYGGSYNPGLPNLKLSALNELAAKARQALEEMNVAKSAMKIAINNREMAFAGLPKLVSSIIFALAASSASEPTMKDARAIVRQMTGRRKYRPPVASGEATSPAEKGRSLSQLGYESMTDHFARLVQFLRDEPLYQPAEMYLSLEGLAEQLSKLRALNTAVKDARVAFSNARVALMQLYYGDTHSVVATARSAKMYVRAIFGLSSMEYQQVRNIHFTKPRFR